MRWHDQSNCMQIRPGRYILDTDFPGEGYIKLKHAAAITT